MCNGIENLNNDEIVRWDDAFVFDTSFKDSKDYFKETDNGDDEDWDFELSMNLTTEDHEHNSTNHRASPVTISFHKLNEPSTTETILTLLDSLENFGIKKKARLQKFSLKHDLKPSNQDGNSEMKTLSEWLRITRDALDTLSVSVSDNHLDLYNISTTVFDDSHSLQLLSNFIMNVDSNLSSTLIDSLENILFGLKYQLECYSTSSLAIKKWVDWSHCLLRDLFKKEILGTHSYIQTKSISNEIKCRVLRLAVHTINIHLHLCMAFGRSDDGLTATSERLYYRILMNIRCMRSHLLAQPQQQHEVQRVSLEHRHLCRDLEAFVFTSLFFCNMDMSPVTGENHRSLRLEFENMSRENDSVSENVLEESNCRASPGPLRSLGSLESLLEFGDMEDQRVVPDSLARADGCDVSMVDSILTLFSELECGSCLHARLCLGLAAPLLVLASGASAAVTESYFWSEALDLSLLVSGLEEFLVIGNGTSIDKDKTRLAKMAEFLLYMAARDVFGDCPGSRGSFDDRHLWAVGLGPFRSHETGHSSGGQQMSPAVDLWGTKFASQIMRMLGNALLTGRPHLSLTAFEILLKQLKDRCPKEERRLGKEMAVLAASIGECDLSRQLQAELRPSESLADVGDMSFVASLIAKHHCDRGAFEVAVLELQSAIERIRLMIAKAEGKSGLAIQAHIASENLQLQLAELYMDMGLSEAAVRLLLSLLCPDIESPRRQRPLSVGNPVRMQTVILLLTEAYLSLEDSDSARTVLTFCAEHLTDFSSASLSAHGRDSELALLSARVYQCQRDVPKALEVLSQMIRSKDRLVALADSQVRGAGQREALLDLAKALQLKGKVLLEASHPTHASAMTFPVHAGGKAYECPAELLRDAVKSLRDAVDLYRRAGSELAVAETCSLLAQAHLQTVFVPVVMFGVPIVEAIKLEGNRPLSGIWMLTVRGRSLGATGWTEENDVDDGVLGLGERTAGADAECGASSGRTSNSQESLNEDPTAANALFLRETFRVASIALDTYTFSCLPLPLLEAYLNVAEVLLVQGELFQGLAFWVEAKDLFVHLFVYGPQSSSQSSSLAMKLKPSVPVLRRSSLLVARTVVDILSRIARYMYAVAALPGSNCANLLSQHSHIVDLCIAASGDLDRLVRTAGSSDSSTRLAAVLSAMTKQQRGGATTNAPQRVRETASGGQAAVWIGCGRSSRRARTPPVMDCLSDCGELCLPDSSGRSQREPESCPTQSDFATSFLSALPPVADLLEQQSPSNKVVVTNNSLPESDSKPAAGTSSTSSIKQARSGSVFFPWLSLAAVTGRQLEDAVAVNSWRCLVLVERCRRRYVAETGFVTGSPAVSRHYVRSSCRKYLKALSISMRQYRGYIVKSHRMQTVTQRTSLNRATPVTTGKVVASAGDLARTFVRQLPPQSQDNFLAFDSSDDAEAVSELLNCRPTVGSPPFALRRPGPMSHRPENVASDSDMSRSQPSALKSPVDLESVEAESFHVIVTLLLVGHLLCVAAPALGKSAVFPFNVRFVKYADWQNDIGHTDAALGRDVSQTDVKTSSSVQLFAPLLSSLLQLCLSATDFQRLIDADRLPVGTGAEATDSWKSALAPVTAFIESLMTADSKGGMSRGLRFVTSPALRWIPWELCLSGTSSATPASRQAFCRRSRQTWLSQSAAASLSENTTPIEPPVLLLLFYDFSPSEAPDRDGQLVRLHQILQDKRQPQLFRTIAKCVRQADSVWLSDRRAKAFTGSGAKSVSGPNSRVLQVVVQDAAALVAEVAALPSDGRTTFVLLAYDQLFGMSDAVLALTTKGVPLLFCPSHAHVAVVAETLAASLLKEGFGSGTIHRTLKDINSRLPLPIVMLL